MRLGDKLAFMLSCIVCMLIVYEIGHDACNFYQIYTTIFSVALLIRIIDYKPKKLHYYLLEFCWFANAHFCIHLWFFNTSRASFICAFAYSSGPLAMATVLL